MSVLYLKLLSLFFCASLGYIGARYLDIAHRPIATLIVYIISPVFCFLVMASTPLPMKQLQLVPIYGAMCIIIGIGSYVTAQKVFGDTRAHVAALGLSTPNLGYYGIPVILVLYDDSKVALFMLFSLGVALSVYTFGFYIMNRTIYSFDESVKKFLKLPILYATALGIAYSHTGLTLPEFTTPMTEIFKGAYSLLGLLMIGLGFGSMTKISFDWRFLAFLNAGKFLIYPAATLLLVYIDNHTFRVMNAELQGLFILSSLMPVGINTINFSSITGERTAEAATGVLISTVLSTILIPLYVSISGMHMH